jgi:hypothetical protein
VGSGCRSAEPLAPTSLPTPDTGVLASFAGTSITVHHFEAAYARDVGSWTAAQSHTSDAYASFLSAYVDHQLKVKAAQEAGIDQDPALRAQLQRYRHRMARSQLRSDSVLTPVIRALHGQERQHRTHASFSDGQDALQRQAEQLPGIRAAERAFFARLRNRHLTRVDTAALLRSLGAARLTHPAVRALRSAHRPNAPIVVVHDSVYTTSALVAFWNSTPTMQHETVRGVLDAFTRHAVMDHVARRLEQTAPSFRHQIQDYWEGLLVFKLMQDSVWTPALQDTAAQIAYFKQHRERYGSSPRASRRSGVRPSAAPLQMAEPTLLASRTAQGLASVRLDPVLIAEGVAPSLRTAPSRISASRSPTGSWNDRDEADLAARTQEVPSVRFADVQSQVVRDFQAYRERLFVRRLHARYQTQLFPNQLHTAFQQNPAHATAALPPSH